MGFSIDARVHWPRVLFINDESETESIGVIHSQSRRKGSDCFPVVCRKWTQNKYVVMNSTERFNVGKILTRQVVNDILFATGS